MELGKNHLVLLLIGISLITINPRVNGWNEASRMALTQSLVENGSFTIDKSPFTQTGDKVYIDGQFYSDKPPLPSILAAAAYFPIYHLGIHLDYGWNLAYYLIILFTIKFWWVLSILAFRRILILTGVAEDQLTKLTLIFAFASLAFSWSATFNNHSLAASWSTIALMYYLQGDRRSNQVQDLMLSGLFFGLAGAADVPISIFFLSFGILVFMKQKFSTGLFVYLGAGLTPLSIYGLVNYFISGSLVPVQIVGEHFQFAGSVWGQGLQVNSLLETLQYGFLSLFGVRGFVWYNPLLIILIPLIVAQMKTENRHRDEAIAIGLSSIILILYYIIFTQNYGGWSYSIRWFVPLLPYFYLFLTSLEIDRNRYTRIIVPISIIISIIGLINPWSNADLHPVPLIANLKQLSLFLF